MWTEYDLTMVVETLVGGIPRHPEIVRRWQEAKWPTNPPAGLSIDDAVSETIEELGSQAMAAEDAAAIWTGFAEKDGQLVLEERNVKAMLKESANIVKDLADLKKRNTKGDDKAMALRSKLAERVFVSPKWIPLGVSEPSESVERPIHVMTRLGPRSALKRTDVIRDVKVNCQLTVLDDGVITEKILRAILDHASRNGLGTDRSQGNGTFTYTLTAV